MGECFSNRLIGISSYSTKKRIIITFYTSHYIYLAIVRQNWLNLSASAKKKKKFIPKIVFHWNPYQIKLDGHSQLTSHVTKVKSDHSATNYRYNKSSR